MWVFMAPRITKDFVSEHVETSLGCQVHAVPAHFLAFPPPGAETRGPRLGPDSPSAPGTSELRVDLMDFEGNHQFAKYTSFKVAGEAEKYRLVLGAFVEGSAGEGPPGARGPASPSTSAPHG